MSLTRVCSAGLVASAALVLAACPSSDVQPRLGETFVLGVGDTTSIAYLGLWLRFAQVASDSRCPTQVSCVSAGDAAVVLETAPYLGDSRLDSRIDTLHTTLDPRSVVVGQVVGQVELQLVQLDPYPTTTDPIPLRTYRLTLITRPIPLD